MVFVLKDQTGILNVLAASRAHKSIVSVLSSFMTGPPYTMPISMRHPLENKDYYPSTQQLVSSSPGNLDAHSLLPDTQEESVALTLFDSLIKHRFPSAL